MVENDSLGSSQLEATEYAGFWLRLAATLVDTVILLVITLPLTAWIYNDMWENQEQIIMGTWDVIINWVFPAVAVIAFWLWKGGTPGKLLFSLQVVDAKNGGRLSLVQSIIRYLGYIVSTLPLCLGFLWVAFDKEKQGLHDKLAGTLVVRVKNS